MLRREEDGSWWLQTPAERGRIEVEDAPFVAVELDWTGDGRQQVLSFRTNIDEVVTAGPDHPIRVSHDLFTCEPTPYILVRPGAAGHLGVEARINRATYYELVALAVPEWVGNKRHAGRLEPRKILFPGRAAARRGVTPPALRLRLAEIAAEPPDGRGSDLRRRSAGGLGPAAGAGRRAGAGGDGRGPSVLLTKRTVPSDQARRPDQFPGRPDRSRR